MKTEKPRQKVEKTDLSNPQRTAHGCYEKPQIKKQQQLAEVTGGKKVTGGGAVI